MDILHSQVNNIQRHLAFVAVDDIDWRFYIQLFSWSVSLFESYLLCGGFFCQILPVSNIFIIIKGFDSTLCTPRQNLPHHLQSILKEECLKSPKNMEKIKPSSPCSREFISSSWILLCSSQVFMHGLGELLKALWTR